MSSVMTSNEQVDISVIEQINQNMLNYTSCENNDIFDQWMFKNDALIEKTNSGNLNGKENIVNTFNIEAIEKEYINNIVEDSISTEDADDFLFSSPDDFLNCNKYNKFNLRKVHTNHNNENENNMFLTKGKKNICVPQLINKEKMEGFLAHSSKDNILCLNHAKNTVNVNNVISNTDKSFANYISQNVLGTKNSCINDIYNSIPNSLSTNISLISSLSNEMNCSTNTDMSKNYNCNTRKVIDNETDNHTYLENKCMNKKQLFINHESFFNKNFAIQSECSTNNSNYTNIKKILDGSVYNLNNDNNNNNNTHFNKAFKNIIINLIETGDDDVELFERIVDIISEHYKKKNINKRIETIKLAAKKNYMYDINNANKCLNEKVMKNFIGNAFTNKEEAYAYKTDIHFMKNNRDEINNLDASFYNNMNTPTKLSSAHQFASQVDSCRKLHQEELNINTVIESTMKGNKYINGSIITDSYSNALKNQLSAEIALEKEQVLLHLKREIKMGIENGMRKERKNIIKQQNEKNNGTNYLTNDKISTVKFNFETDVVENTRKFNEEMNSGSLSRSMKSFKDEIKRNNLAPNTAMTVINANIPTNFNNGNDKNVKWNTNNTFRNQKEMKNLKNFFSECESKNQQKKYNESSSLESKGSSLWNRNMNFEKSNMSSKNIKTDRSNLKKNDISKKEFCHERLFKSQNVTTIKNKSSENNSNASSKNKDYNKNSKSIYKNDNSKINLKPKNNTEIQKLSSTELKNIITKSDELCLKNMLESLYDDRILPFLFNLNGRAEEMKCREIIRNNLFTAYGLFPNEYEVKKAKTGDDYVVMFANKTVSDDYFIYLNNTEDKYDENMWKHFSEYLEKIANSNDPSMYEFSGGRYGMAKELKNRNLFFFENLCLGEICQIVHLSTNKKLIAYEHNFLKPISKCHKYANAKLGILNAVNENKEDFITTIEELKYYIKSLLKYYKGGFNISTLKKKLKTRFNKQICESVFHCIKLIEVLQLEELKELCVVDKDLKFIQSV